MYYVLEAIDKPMRAIFFASPRKVLFITSLIMFLSSLIMSVFSVYMCQMFYDPIATNAAWLNFLGLAVVGAFLGCVCLLGMRGAHIVTLDYLLYYFWLMVVLIAPLALGCVVCFDFIIYMQLWFSHSWDTDAFENVRRIACEEGTANTKCMAPVDGGSGYNSTELWCMAEFNGATDCEAIRDAAQSQAQLWGRLLMLVEAIVTVSNIGLILFSLYLCHKILTSPVLTQSMNDVMNFLLLMPTAACLVLAIYNWWMREYNIPFYFLAEVYLGFTVLQFLMLPMGIFAGRMKSQTLMAIYIFVATLTCCGLGATGGVSIMVAGLLPKNYGMTTATKDSVACHRNYPGCCCCDFSVDGNLVTGRCPEWSTADTVIELSIDFKISGIISFLCMSYHVGALAVSSLVHQNLQSYKSDYI